MKMRPNPQGAPARTGCGERTHWVRCRPHPLGAVAPAHTGCGEAHTHYWVRAAHAPCYVRRAAARASTLLVLRPPPTVCTARTHMAHRPHPHTVFGAHITGCGSRTPWARRPHPLDAAPAPTFHCIHWVRRPHPLGAQCAARSLTGSGARTYWVRPRTHWVRHPYPPTGCAARSHCVRRPHQLGTVPAPTHPAGWATHLNSPHLM